MLWLSFLRRLVLCGVLYLHCFAVFELIVIKNSMFILNIEKFTNKEKEHFQIFKKIKSSERFDRYLFTNQHYDIDLELHGFCDASSEAYSVLFYYVRSCKDVIIETNLVTAKSEIVPSKKLTVTKLELMSCLLLSRLIVPVKKRFLLLLTYQSLLVGQVPKLVCVG